LDGDFITDRRYIYDVMVELEVRVDFGILRLVEHDSGNQWRAPSRGAIDRKACARAFPKCRLVVRQISNPVIVNGPIPR
jgi:hypothetical protein